MRMSNEYMNRYMKERWERRRQEAISYLGGECSQCGNNRDLEFDHIDQTNKLFTIATGSSYSNERFWNEVDKCQLLCDECHTKKHATAKESHGTLSSYRYCRCVLCKKAHSDYCKLYNKRYRKSGICTECQVTIDRRSTRCKGCSVKHRYQIS
jgi:hypothetical protein